MNILLIYGTNSSGTAEVAERIGAILRSHGHQVTAHHAREATAETLNQPTDLIILGSCTWERFTSDGERLEGQLQHHMYQLLENANPPAGRAFALFALGDSSYTDFCRAADHLEAAVKGWSGTNIAPTLRVDAYFFDLEKNRACVDAWATSLASVLKK